jgi:(2R)-3-sulfolactate dehydrogenase (NADP+)
MSDTVTLSLSQAEALLERAFLANGVPALVASSVARALVAAEAEGQAGHGFSRVADYIGQVRTGKIQASAIPVTSKTAPAALRTHAGHGFAYPALDQAIDEGCALAVEMGVSSVAVAHSHHCGALSVQVRRIAERGMVGLMMANAPAAIAPWGASTPLYGTNPIAFAAPRAGGEPMVIDLSLSRVARGKVMHAYKIGSAIPEGWALAPDGSATTDPAQGLAGTMVPIGEAKGTSLALMVEIFAALLTGAAMSRQASSFFTAEGPPPRVGQYLIALKPHEQSGFSERLEELLATISHLEGARLPGERRAASIKTAQEHGLEVPLHYVEQVQALAGVSARGDGGQR